MVKGAGKLSYLCYSLRLVAYILVIIGAIFIILGLYGDGMNALASTSFLSLISTIFILGLVFFHLSDRWNCCR